MTRGRPPAAIDRRGAPGQGPCTSYGICSLSAPIKNSGPPGSALGPRTLRGSPGLARAWPDPHRVRLLGGSPDPFLLPHRRRGHWRCRRNPAAVLRTHALCVLARVDPYPCRHRVPPAARAHLPARRPGGRRAPALTGQGRQEAPARYPSRMDDSLGALRRGPAGADPCYVRPGGGISAPAQSPIRVRIRRHAVRPACGVSRPPGPTGVAGWRWDYAWPRPRDLPHCRPGAGHAGQRPVPRDIPPWCGRQAHPGPRVKPQAYPQPVRADNRREADIAPPWQPVRSRGYL